MLFIPELFGPVLECLTLDWPAQDCPAGRFAFFCPRRPTRFDLLLDGFSGPRQIHLYLNSHLKGPRDLLVAVHGGALTYLPRRRPNFFCSSALWDVGDVFLLLLLLWLCEVFLLLLLLLSILCVQAFAEFCWLKLQKKLCRPQSEFTRHL